MWRMWYCALWLLLTALPTGSVFAAAPIESFWRLPAYRLPILSENGRYFAVTVPLRERMNLAVIDVETMKAAMLTGFEDFDVVDVHWVGNEFLAFSLGHLNTPTGPEYADGGGLYAISRDGKESRKLSHTVRELRKGLGTWKYRWLEYLAPVPGSDEEFLATEADDAWERTVLKVNARTGRSIKWTPTRPRRVSAWILDRNLVPRVTVSWVPESTESVVSFQESSEAPWVELYRQKSGADRIIPLAFDDDNHHLIVASDKGRDTLAIHRYDPSTRELGEVLAGHPRFDMGADHTGRRIPGIVLDRNTRQLVGFRINGPKPDTVWIDSRYARVQAMIDAALPGRINVFTGDPGDNRLVVASYSDRQPLRWYFLHTQRRRLEPIFDSAPWLKEDDLVPMEPFFYRSRDGLEILGYRFLPSGYKAGDRLPLVVHVHGGPHVRADHWGFGTFGTREAQLLASRGYAVIVPNFRITPGFGRKIYRAGFRQFGRAMQDDIEDAADWAVAQGFADPARICLSGASYGGYAALMGVAKTPDKYKCAIAGLAVTDIEMLLTSSYGDIPYNRTGGLQLWYSMVGNPSDPKDREAMRAVSPAYLADRIKAPVLMYSGVDDWRVPLEQPNKMRAAMRAAGKDVDWIEKSDEGHGFGKLENNVDLYNQILGFLRKHIGPPAKGE
jgi:dipeptidyl aminopeptidase/acylaminoacyl peptidase